MAVLQKVYRNRFNFFTTVWLCLIVLFMLYTRRHVVSYQNFGIIYKSLMVGNWKTNKIDDFFKNASQMVVNGAKPTFGIYEDVCTDSLCANKNQVSRKWVRVGHSDVYVFAAYYSSVDKEVLVIGLAPQKTPNPELNCTFQEGAAAKTVNGFIKWVPDSHGESYTAVFIHCKVSQKMNMSTIEIAIGNASVTLRVIHNRPEDRRYNFSVCVSSLFGPYKNRFDLIQMIEADVIYGAQHIIFYNYSVTPEVNKVLAYYINKGLVEVVNWNLPEIGIHYYGQLASLQDCLYSNKHVSKYLVLKDVDELIVPNKHKSWAAMMDDLFKDKPKTASFLFRNSFFDLNFKPDGKNYSLWNQSVDLNVRSLQYVWRDKMMFKPNKRSKIIMKPEFVNTAGIHFSWSLAKTYNEEAVNPTIAYLHHYRYWSNSTQRVKDESARKIGPQLIENIQNTLTGLDVS